METSVTIIGIVIAIIVAIPIYYSARSNAANKSKILGIKKKFNPTHRIKRKAWGLAKKIR